MGKFRILHVIDSLAVGGAERMPIELANATYQDGNVVGVCVTREEAQLARELQPGIPVGILGRTSRFDLKAVPRIQALLKELSPDVLHCHGRSTCAFLAFLKSANVISSPVVLHDHFGEIEADQSVPFWFKYWALRFVDAYAGVSPSLSSWALSAGFSGQQVVVIENALAVERIREAKPLVRDQLGVCEGDYVGLIVGRVHQQKGIDVLIDACARIDRELPWIMLVVGRPSNQEYDRKCKEKIASFGLNEKIRFLGARDDIPSIIKTCDFAVIPSISESGPLVLIEYLAGGLPFIATRVGGISSRVEARGLGRFVRPGSIDELAEAIREVVLLSRDDRLGMVERGVEVAEEEFDIQRVLPKWYELYERVTQGKK